MDDKLVFFDKTKYIQVKIKIVAFGHFRFKPTNQDVVPKIIEVNE